MAANITPHRSEIRRLVSTHGATNPRLVGAKSPHVEAAILVDLKPGTTGADMSRLQSELEELLRGRVDLLTPRDVPAKQRASVLQSLNPI
ncbi:MAG TPA: nucleotidyltransferase [Burkholderiaceae bacterium]